MKILHMIMAMLVVLLSLVQCWCLVAAVPRKVPVAVKILTHLAYLLVIMLGIALFVRYVQLHIYPAWLLLKISLFVTAIVALSYAGKNPVAHKPRIAVAIVVAAYLAIFALAGAKPSFGQNLSPRFGDSPALSTDQVPSELDSPNNPNGGSNNLGNNVNNDTINDLATTSQE